jgi:pterin-4a-carbinolamine dehydratase
MTSFEDADARKPLIFISYRRIDTKSRVSSLTQDLALHFGPESIFVDTDKIRAGTDWRTALNNALEASTVLLVAIGEKWFSATGTHHRRRIDSEDDWVRNEILHALKTGKAMIPVLLDGQRPLTEESLPEEIRSFAGIQALELRESDWQADFDRLLTRLREYGFVPSRRNVRYPNPVIKEPAATEAEIREFLHRYPDWQVQYRRHPTDPGAQRRGIGTTLDFRSFSDAMHFMATAAWGINERNHHPEWENIWKTVVIWITQFDIGGDITNRNIELAEYLMSVYTPYGAVAT